MDKKPIDLQEMAKQILTAPSAPYMPPPQRATITICEKCGTEGIEFVCHICKEPRT